MVRTRGQQQRARTTKGKRTPQKKRSSVPAQRDTLDYDRFLKAMHVTKERKGALAGAGRRGLRSATDTLKKGPAFQAHLKRLRHVDAFYRSTAAMNPLPDAAAHATNIESDRVSRAGSAWRNMASQGSDLMTVRQSHPPFNNNPHTVVSDSFVRDATQARANRSRHMSKFFNY